MGFQSTLPLRGATRTVIGQFRFLQISIHAPLTGSDFRGQTSFTNGKDFNPRSPYGERLAHDIGGVLRGGFQSTLPLRGATFVTRAEHNQPVDFNPRSPYGERLFSGGCCPATKVISIHAPLTGSDPDNVTVAQGDTKFQSTLPLRGATIHPLVCGPNLQISIHAPLTGSDPFEFGLAGGVEKFQSTLPLRGATAPTQIPNFNRDNFNPRSPYGERPIQRKASVQSIIFQSTLPLRGATIHINPVNG